VVVVKYVPSASTNLYLSDMKERSPINTFQIQLRSMENRMI
jgi:hypothetical protein